VVQRNRRPAPNTPESRLACRDQLRRRQFAADGSSAGELRKESWAPPLFEPEPQSRRLHSQIQASRNGNPQKQVPVHARRSTACACPVPCFCGQCIRLRKGLSGGLSPVAGILKRRGKVCLGGMDDLNTSCVPVSSSGFAGAPCPVLRLVMDDLLWDVRLFEMDGFRFSKTTKGCPTKSNDMTNM